VGRCRIQKTKPAQKQAGKERTARKTEYRSTAEKGGTLPFLLEDPTLGPTTTVDEAGRVARGVRQGGWTATARPHSSAALGFRRGAQARPQPTDFFDSER